MQYTKIDRDEVGLAIFKADALDAEKAAFSSECELSRLEALKDLELTEEETILINDSIKAQKELVTKTRKRASRKQKLTTVEESEIEATKKEFLDAWIEGIEKEHAAQSAVLAIQDQTLDDEDEDALNESEREQIEAGMKDLLVSLKILESAWNVAQKKISELDIDSEEEHTH